MHVPEEIKICISIIKLHLIVINKCTAASFTSLMKTIKLNLFPTPQKFHSNFVSQRSQENRKYIHTGIFTGHGHSKSQIEVHLLCESKQSGQSTGCKALNRAMGYFTTTGIHLAKHLKSIGMSLTIL